MSEKLNFTSYKRLKTVKAGLMCVALIATSPSLTHATSLEEYLNQVRSQNKEQIGTTQQAEAASYKAYEGGLIFTPSFFAEGRRSKDGKQSSPPMLTYDYIETEAFAAGIKQQFSFGLQAKLQYQLVHTNFVNAPALTGKNDFYDASPAIELTMPIWGNGFGRTARAQQEALQSSGNAESLGAQAKLTGLEVDAENAYWNLAVAKNILSIQEQALKQAEAIYDYVNKKAQMRLGEDSDVLQAKALVISRQLELKKAQTEESNARLTFNTFRGSDSSEVKDQLDAIPYNVLLNMQLPKERPGDRFDVQAAEAQLKAATASAHLELEKNRPTFDIFGGYSLNGRDKSYDDAMGALYGDDRGTRFIGARLNIPLNFSATSKLRQSARLTEEAQRNIYQQKQLTQERDWSMLTTSFNDAKGLLGLSNDLVSAQDIKLKTEQRRLRQGKTTTYQVLMFEQDKSQSEIARLQLTKQLLSLKSNLKMYQANSQKEVK